MMDEVPIGPTLQRQMNPLRFEPPDQRYYQGWPPKVRKAHTFKSVATAASHRARFYSDVPRDQYVAAAVKTLVEDRITIIPAEPSLHQGPMPGQLMDDYTGPVNDLNRHRPHSQ